MAFIVPGYHVDQLIGYGTHAEVWSGRTAGTDEPVALKRIVLPVHGDPGQAAELVTAARTEAALLTALQHPSLIAFHRYIQTPAAVVLVMELAEGGSLAQLLRRRDRLSPAEVAAALSPVAAALACAHAEGVMHGDVSAANILFTAVGQPKLADLGVARMVIGQAGPDRALGTPAYLDPVVAAGGAAGPPSDVFSLGAVALRCLTGAGPWHAGDPADLGAVLARAAAGVIEDLPGKLAGCPDAMAAVLSRALDLQPHRRCSAAEFALELRASVPTAPVVLTAGRIMPAGPLLPGVGRHSVERHGPVGMAVVPADLTHVARLRVRAELAEPGPRHRGLRGLAVRGAGRGAGRAAVRAAVRGAVRGAVRRPVARPMAMLATVLLGIAVLAVVAVGGHGWPTLAAGHRTAAPTPSRPAPSDPLDHARSADGRRADSGTASSAARLDGSRPGARTAQPGGPAATAESAAARTVQPGRTDPAIEGPEAPDAMLRSLADRRAKAFALNRPELLTGVYQSPALLAQDLSLLSSRVPAGCGLTGLHARYRDVRVISAGPRHLDVRVTASQPPASLVCAGTVRSRTGPAGPTRLLLHLVRVGTEFRIASQRLIR